MDRTTPPLATPPPPLAPSLGMAIVLASSTPLVLLDSAFVVRAASASFCAAFGLAPDVVTGRTLFALGSGEWDLPQLRSLLSATLSGQAEIAAYELDVASPGGVRHLVLHAQRLEYAEAADLRLLLAIADVTAVRLAEQRKDDLLREKQVLLQELQHRVANSLQIIASVLILSARRVQSEEARSSLSDAHQRVMSIATLQRQLAASHSDEVALQPYFTDLCRTIGASMIADPATLRITPGIADVVVSSDACVSLGLIVTELIINALKHGYPPDTKRGEIAVTYTVDGADWTLTVRDDGVGRPAKVVPGLGSGIVAALAAKLKAVVAIRDADPGTCVTITHRAGDDPAAS